MVNIHSLHNERIPLNLIDCREKYLPSSKRKAVCMEHEPQTSACLPPEGFVLSSEHLRSCSNTLIQVVLVVLLLS